MEVFLALTLVTAANAAVAAAEHGNRLQLFAYLIMGPFSGLAIALHMHDVPSAVWPTICASFASVLPLAAYAHRPIRVALVVGSILWFLSAYFFCIAIWI